MFLFLLYFYLASTLLSVLSISIPTDVIQGLTFTLDGISSISCNQPDDDIKIPLYCNSSQKLTIEGDGLSSQSYTECLNKIIPDIRQFLYTCNSNTHGIIIRTQNYSYISNNSELHNGANTININRYDQSFNFTLSMILSDSAKNEIRNNNNDIFKKKLYCNSNGQLSFERDLNTNTYDSCLLQIAPTLESHFTNPFGYENYLIIYEKWSIEEYIYIYEEKYTCNYLDNNSFESLSNIQFRCQIDIIPKSLQTYKYFDYIHCFDGYIKDQDLVYIYPQNNKLIQYKQSTSNTQIESCELGCKLPNNLSKFGLELNHDIEGRHAILKCEEGKEKTNNSGNTIICRTMGAGVYNWYSGNVIIDSDEKYQTYGCYKRGEGEQLDDQTTTATSGPKRYNMHVMYLFHFIWYLFIGI